MPLFEGIISDLFPGSELPKPDFGVFLDALKENIAKRKLQAVPWFIDKIIQVVNTFCCIYLWHLRQFLCILKKITNKK